MDAPRAAALVLLPLLAAACASVPSPPAPPTPAGTPLPNFSFAHDFGNCSAGAAPVVLKANPGEVRVAGEVWVPNPCHKLAAWPRTAPGEVVLDITRHPSPSACVQCVGAIPFAASVGSLERGVTAVRVVVNGSELANATLYVPGPDERAPACGGSARLPCLAGHRCVPAGTFPDAGGFCVPEGAA
ncbi:MAG: hypothetical protein QXO51_01810 [Halobacteria archaeon]